MSSVSDLLIPFSFSYSFRLLKPAVGPPVLLRLLSYGNENDNGNDKHLRSRTELLNGPLAQLVKALHLLKLRVQVRSPYYPKVLPFFEIFSLTWSYSTTNGFSTMYHSWTKSGDASAHSFGHSAKTPSRGCFCVGFGASAYAKALMFGEHIGLGILFIDGRQMLWAWKEIARSQTQTITHT